MKLFVSLCEWFLALSDEYPGTTNEFRAFARQHAHKFKGSKPVHTPEDVIFWYPEECRIYMYYFQTERKSPFLGDKSGIQIQLFFFKAKRCMPPCPGTF